MMMIPIAIKVRINEVKLVFNRDLPDKPSKAATIADLKIFYTNYN